MLINSPLEQFEIHPIFKLGILWLDFSITNATLSLLMVLGIVSLLTLLILSSPRLIPTRWQTLLETFYEFNKEIIKDQIGEKGIPYFPMIFTLFLFLIISNLLGMIPYNFTITTQLVTTFLLSITIFTGVTILGFKYHQFNFLKLFLPEGSPLFLAPLLIVIEIISYFARVISLAVRLTANMMAGHTLLNIIAGFAWKILLSGGILSLGGLFPLASLLILMGLEIAIATLQAYVFTILTATYLKDSINLH
jgi:ATP synthase subunit 6